jgi:hypothetical protein
MLGFGMRVGSVGRRRLREEELDGLFDLAVGAIGHPEDSVSIDEVVVGEAVGAVSGDGFAVDVFGDGVFDPFRFRDLLHFFGTAAMADADKDDALIRVFFGEGVVLGNAGDTGAAPGGPEVEDDDFPFQVLESEGVLGVERAGQGECRGGARILELFEAAAQLFVAFEGGGQWAGSECAEGEASGAQGDNRGFHGELIVGREAAGSQGEGRPSIEGAVGDVAPAPSS